jgi:membrane associated rhomboid family serine protease
MIREVTLLLLLLNAFIFLVEPHENSPLFRRFYEARYSLSAQGLEVGYWWQLLTYQFMHGGWVHLGANLILLHSMGPILETTLGRRRFLILYLFSGATGGAVHLAGAILSPDTFGHPVVGASAGLCGLLAALGWLYAEQQIRGYLFLIIPFRVRANFLCLIAGMITLGGAFFPLGNVAHLAHLGGFVGGLICMNCMNAKPLELCEIPEDSKPGNPG